MSRTSLAAALLLALTGCDLFSADKPVTVALCDESEAIVGAGDLTPMGFSADQMMAVVAGELADTFRYASGGSTPLTLRLSTDSRVALFADRAAGDGAVFETGTGDEACRSSLSINATLAFSTEDGAFAETLSGTVWAEDLDLVRFKADIDPDALVGDLDVSAALPEGDWASVALDLEGSSDGVNSWGGVGGQATSPEVCDETGVCVTSTSPFGVGDWRHGGW